MLSAEEWPKKWSVMVCEFRIQALSLKYSFGRVSRNQPYHQNANHHLHADSDADTVSRT